MYSSRLHVKTCFLLSKACWHCAGTRFFIMAQANFCQTELRTQKGAAGKASMFVSLSAFTWFEVVKASRAGFGPFMEVWFIVSFKQLVKLSSAIFPQLA